MSQQIPTTGVIFNDLLKARTHKARVSGPHIHIYNATTGVTEFILKKDYPGNTRLVEKQIDGRTIFVEEDILMSTVTVPKRVAFSEVLLELLCDRIVQGDSLKTICNSEGMPSYAQLCAWKRSRPGVEERLAQAREDRGEWLRDLAMEEMDGADEDTVAVATARHKALVWAAGVDNSRYSPKAKVEASFNVPTQILVYTGIGVPNGSEAAREANGDKQVLSGGGGLPLPTHSAAGEELSTFTGVDNDPNTGVSGGS